RPAAPVCAGLPRGRRRTRARTRQRVRGGRRPRGLGGAGRRVARARGRRMSAHHASTIFAAFMRTAEEAPDHAFLCAPPAPGRAYHPDGVEYPYAETRAEALRLRDAYAAAGYGHGHRVAPLLE